MLSLDEPKLRAGVLSWLGTLEDEGTLDVSTTVSLLVVGLKYGQQSALVEDLITDRLETPVALLRANDPSAAQVAIDGVALAAEAARQLGKITTSPSWVQTPRCLGRVRKPSRPKQPS